jgi:hypothetical protein
MSEDNAAIVTSWLRSKPERYYCQSCVSENTGVGPATKVNKIVEPLGNTREWRYTATLCDGCGRSRKCIKFVGEPPAPTTLG